MDIQEIFKQKAINYNTDSIDGIECTIGYIKKFRLGWTATQLNTFVIVGETSELIDKKRIERFSGEAINYAIKNNKGWPRGFQSSVSSIAILKGEEVDITAIGFCENPTKKHLAAFEIPVVYDATSKRGIKYKNKPLWGRIYFPYFTKTIDGIIEKFD
jgi:hypothetical protein